MGSCVVRRAAPGIWPAEPRGGGRIAIPSHIVPSMMTGQGIFLSRMFGSFRPGQYVILRHDTFPITPELPIVIPPLGAHIRTSSQA
jgi:hypothetical protein